MDYSVSRTRSGDVIHPSVGSGAETIRSTHRQVRLKVIIRIV